MSTARVVLIVVAFMTAGCNATGTDVPSAQPTDIDAQPSIPADFNHDMLAEAQAIQPIGTPSPGQLTREAAISAAIPELRGIGGTDQVVFTEYGLGVAHYGDPPTPIWLVVVSANPLPQPGGPACETDPSCSPAQIAYEYAGAIVSATTGEVEGMLNQGHVVVPSP